MTVRRKRDIREANIYAEVSVSSRERSQKGDCVQTRYKFQLQERSIELDNCGWYTANKENYCKACQNIALDDKHRPAPRMHTYSFISSCSMSLKRSFVLLLAVLGTHGFASQPCPNYMSVNLENGTTLANGSVLFDGQIYPPEARYTWQVNETRRELRGCPCLVSTCLRECCAPDEYFQRKRCLKRENQTLNALARSDLARRFFDPAIQKPDSYFYRFVSKHCPNLAFNTYLTGNKSRPNQNLTIAANGHLLVHVDALKGHEFYDEPQDSYCVSWLSDPSVLMVIRCFTDDENVAMQMDKLTRWSQSVGNYFSAFFLILTVCVYALIPTLRTLHGMTLMSYSSCLALAYIFHPLVRNMEIQNTVLDDTACVVIAYIVHFSFLASFFWLNVMCFDIWWTFGGFRTLHGSVKQRERKKFIMYSIYAWGCASALTIVCMIMDFVPNIPDTAIRPGFGKGSCWFSTNWARFIYFYGPMGVTVICNICLFVLTALKILRHKKDTARQLKGSESRRHDDNKQWFNLYLKLFIVMGINWSMEIISWLFENTLPKYVWYITDLTNTLQGVIIFIIFVWKDKIKRLLMKRFGCQGTNFLSRNSTSRSGPTSSASRTTCVTQATMQEKVNPYADSYRAKAAAAAATNHTVTDESDCV